MQNREAVVRHLIALLASRRRAAPSWTARQRAYRLLVLSILDDCDATENVCREARGVVWPVGQLTDQLRKLHQGRSAYRHRAMTRGHPQAEGGGPRCRP
jgi:hypothetical protein